MDDRLTSTTSVLDRSALDRLVETCGDGGAEVVASLLETFFADVPLLLSGLEAALSRSDDQEVRRLGHTIKSHGVTFGAPLLAHLAFELESLGSSGRLAGGHALLSELVQEYTLVHPELRTAKAELLGSPCPVR